MLHQDVGMLGLHVVFAVDRAGIVGGDGRTHQGVFDVAMLSTVPGMEIWCPASFAELRDMLDRAVTVSDGPVAVRYPRGAEGRWQAGGADPVRVLARGRDLTLLTYGLSINEADTAVRLATDAGLSVGLIKLGRVHPIDFDALFAALDGTGRLAVLEESADAGSVGQTVAAEAARRGGGLQVLRWNAGDGYLPCGALADVRRNCGLDGESIAARILAACEEN